MTLDSFTSAYVQTALWSETDDDGEPLDKRFDQTDLAPETLATMVEDCAKFQAANGEDIDCDGAPVARDTGDDSRAMAGHDFWLARNGHGAGFWDGDWPEPQASRLTGAAEAFGEFNLYIGDDGMIYAFTG